MCVSPSSTKDVLQLTPQSDDKVRCSEVMTLPSFLGSFYEATVFKPLCHRVNLISLGLSTQNQ